MAHRTTNLVKDGESVSRATVTTDDNRRLPTDSDLAGVHSANGTGSKTVHCATDIEDKIQDARDETIDTDIDTDDVRAPIASRMNSDEAEVTELVRFLERENASRRVQFGNLRRIAFGVAMIAVAVIVEHVIRTGKFPAIGVGSFAWVAVFAGGIVATRQQMSSTTRLASMKDKRILGPMVDALEFSQIPMRRLARGVLEDLLPKLLESDAYLLQPYHRRILNNVLRRNSYVRSSAKLKCAILAAYEQVGDESALPIVRDLALGVARAPQSVRAAAIDCLPALQLRMGDPFSNRELLRGAALAEEPATLVRPSSATTNSTPSERPDELLRQEHRWIDP